jgi:hypothetical protein
MEPIRIFALVPLREGVNSTWVSLLKLISPSCVNFYFSMNTHSYAGSQVRVQHHVGGLLT